MQVGLESFGVEIEKRVVKCKVVDSGFDVDDDSAFDDDMVIQRIAHYPNKKTNPKIGVSKEEFEKEIERAYRGAEVEWVKSITGKRHECFVDVLNHKDKVERTTLEEIKDNSYKVKGKPLKDIKELKTLEYDEMNTLEKAKLHNYRLNKKKSKRKGKIEVEYSYYSTDIYKDYKNGKGIGKPLHLKGDRFTSVGFEGHNEGSSSPIDDDKADVEIQQLYLKHSDNYKIEIIDKRKEQRKEFNKLKDKKIVIVLKHDLSYNNLEKDKKGNTCSKKFQNYSPIPHISAYYEGDYEGILGGAGSESFEGNKQKMIDWMMKLLIEDGYSKENITIKEIPLNDETKKKFEKDTKEYRKRDLEYVEKDIERLSARLKDALYSKYGYPVKIIVEKNEKKI